MVKGTFSRIMKIHDSIILVDGPHCLVSGELFEFKGGYGVFPEHTLKLELTELGGETARGRQFTAVDKTHPFCELRAEGVYDPVTRRGFLRYLKR